MFIFSGSCGSQEKWARSPRAGVTSSCEQPDIGAENWTQNSDPLEQQRVLLSTEPSFYSLCVALPMGIAGLKTPHTCVTNTVLTESSCHPWLIAFIFPLRLKGAIYQTEASLKHTLIGLIDIRSVIQTSITIWIVNHFPRNWHTHPFQLMLFSIPIKTVNVETYYI